MYGPFVILVIGFPETFAEVITPVKGNDYLEVCKTLLDLCRQVPQAFKARFILPPDPGRKKFRKEPYDNGRGKCSQSQWQIDDQEKDSCSCHGDQASNKPHQ